jgi:secreted PhoX family phosphatase
MAIQTFADVVEARLTRRGVLRAGLVVTAASVISAGPLARLASAAPLKSQGTAAPAAQALTFTAIPPDTSDAITVADGYRSQVLVAWGDPIFPDVPDFIIDDLTPASQEQRFGYNADFVMYFGLGEPDTGLLWVNHEYTDGTMMFVGYDIKNPTREQVDIELAAHGGSLVQIGKDAFGTWSVDKTSTYNRRITATTPMRLTGPAAGDARLQTSADATGTNVIGMLNNCGGGSTPWGTVLTAEENFNQYFGNGGQAPDDGRRAAHRRYGVTSGESERLWEKYYSRFDVAQEPNEPFRFGWIVEIDPFDPTSVPTKRTALGRFKHEAAAGVTSSAGNYVVYMGDDERFDYVYKFVSSRKVDPDNRAANLNLLDDGTLYVARFNDDGSGTWLPLVFGQGPLTAANGFTSQADILIRARFAGDALGATKMDRPEDVEVNPVTGKVYVTLTNNSNRGIDNNPGVDKANPRARNTAGHMIELTEADGLHTSDHFGWEIFMLAGDPKDPSTYFAGFPKDQVSPIASMDNIAFDASGNLWIATDGQPSALKVNDGVFGVPTQGPERGHVKQLLSAVPGAEVASLVVDSPTQSMFVTIQHPGEGGSLTRPTSVWPTGSVALPAVIVVSREDGGPIGA